MPFSGVRRHARLAEFRLLFLGLLLVAAALSAVGFFSDRVERGLQLRTSAILGADAVLESTRPLNARHARTARAHGLEVARSVGFVSMVSSGGGSRLAGVRAVSSNYPLRGEVALRADGADAVVARTTGPERGTVWAAAQLVKDLDLESAPEVRLGDGRFRFTREILLEPEGGVGMLRLAPRVLMHVDDLDETGLVTPASRARFRLLVAGPEDALAAFAQALEDELAPHESWHVADVRRGEARATVGRVVSYLRLAVTLSMVLAIVAMALAAQGLWRRQTHEIALLRCLGRNHRAALASLAGVYGGAALPVVLLGVGSGYAFQNLAGAVVENALGVALPAPGFRPALATFAMCLAVLAAVMGPALLALRAAPVLTLLRGRSAGGARRDRVSALSVLALIVAVTVVLARDFVLALGVIAGLALAAILLWLVTRGSIALTTGVAAPVSAPWYVALKSLASNSGRSAWLASAFSAAVFALVLLGAVRSDLFEAWRGTAPPDAPNLFLVNIQEPDAAALGALLEAEGIADARLYPVMRGRIAAIDGKPVVATDYGDEMARHRVNHDFNLTELAELPRDNDILEGRWFAQGERSFSIDQGTAELLGLRVGDRLTMELAGLEVDAPVSSIRAVKWDNMRPNFFIIAAHGVLRDAPRQYITSVYAGDRAGALGARVNRAFPGVTAIDLGMLLERFRTLAAQAGRAVSVVFAFTLACAALVLVGVLQGQRSARRREIALLKTLGAGRRYVLLAVLLEFVYLGAFSGLLGGGLALLSGWALAVHVFEFAYRVPWGWLLASAAATAALVAAIGFLSVRSLFAVLPVRLLAREAT